MCLLCWRSQSWVAWIDHVLGRTTDKRDWHTQSDGRNGVEYCGLLSKDFVKIVFYIIRHRDAIRCLANDAMAEWFRLQDQPVVADIRKRGTRGAADSVVYDFIPGGAVSKSKPGGFVKN